MKSMSYKVVDLFAGVGGLSYGFAHDDDFCIVAANEILEPMARAYSANHPDVKMYNKDIKDFSISDPRPLTTREGARLQGFPDSYQFCGSRADKHLQIGNAVPTFLSQAIKDSVKRYLKGE